MVKVWWVLRTHAVNKMPLLPHKLTLLYNFFSTSVMINFYLYLPDNPSIFAHKFEKDAVNSPPSTGRAAAWGVSGKKLPRNYLDLPLCPLSVTLPFVKVQRDSPVHTVPNSSQLSCRAVRTVSTLHTSDFQFSYYMDSREFAMFYQTDLLSIKCKILNKNV